MFRNLFLNFYSPEDSGSGGGSEATETLELLNEAEEPEETLDITSPKGTSPETGTEKDGDDEDEEEEIDELKEIEEELKEPTEEDLELMTPVRRKEILAKYPKLFKDFPYLEKAYYRDQQFTEILPTIKDAKVAVEKAQILDGFERTIMGGDISIVLEAAKQESNEAFYKIADGYLPALRKVDQQAYYHVLGNVVKDTIVTMVREANSLGENGAPLKAAANILNQFVFGSNTFQPSKPLSSVRPPAEDAREQELQQQQHQLFVQQFEGVRDDLQTKADNVLRATIDSHIDPKGSMTDYVKKNATKDAFDTLEDLISRDTRFRGLLDRLWEKAAEKRFDRDSTDRIKSAYLSKAKTLLPSVIKKARNDALRERARSTDDDEIPTSKKGPITPGRSTSPSSGKYKKASEIPKGMTTLDVLMKD